MSEETPEQETPEVESGGARQTPTEFLRESFARIVPETPEPMLLVLIGVSAPPGIVIVTNSGSADTVRRILQDILAQPEFAQRDESVDAVDAVEQRPALGLLQ